MNTEDNNYPVRNKYMFEEKLVQDIAEKIEELEGQGILTIEEGSCAYGIIRNHYIKIFGHDFLYLGDTK